MNSNYRVRRPLEHSNLLNVLRQDSINNGVFESLKSALVFSAAVGFKIQSRVPFSDSAERISISIFKEDSDIPFIFAMAVAEHDDVTYLKSEKFEDSALIFEEYANGGLIYLSEEVDELNVKASIERIIHKLSAKSDNDLIGDVFKDWNV